MVTTFCLFFCLLFAQCSAFERVRSSRLIFEQYAQRAPWDVLNASSADHVLSASQGSFLVSSNSRLLYISANNSVNEITINVVNALSSTAILAFDAALDTLFVANPVTGLFVYACDFQHQTCTLARRNGTLVNYGTVSKMHVSADHVLWIACASGLLYVSHVDPTAILPVPYVSGPASALALSVDGHTLAVSVLSLRGPLGDGPSPQPTSAVLVWDRVLDAWQHFWVGGIIDRNATDLAFDGSGRLWVGTAVCVAWGTPTTIGAKRAWRFERVGGLRENPGSAVCCIVAK